MRARRWYGPARFAAISHFYGPIRKVRGTVRRGRGGGGRRNGNLMTCQPVGRRADVGLAMTAPSVTAGGGTSIGRGPRPAGPAAVTSRPTSKGGATGTSKARHYAAGRRADGAITGTTLMAATAAAHV